MASYGGRYEVQGNAPIGFEMLGIDERELIVRVLYYFYRVFRKIVMISQANI